ncbi:phospholipase A and acyltransferase 4-like [Siphateles boraxobius]|uniref:phospholipase A and acyltransferase 4-like n=1 Tax=Siphateles boraxobius TaxID=180520 RepID=UPI004062EB4C
MANLKQGDLIEISRWIIKHWALYVGDGYVIHLTLASEDANAVSIIEKVVGEDKAKVKREKLEDVVGQDKYCINNHLDKQYEPRPIEDILQDANSRLGEKHRYNLLRNNCEHFVTLLRYGVPQSRQVQ